MQRRSEFSERRTVFFFFVFGSKGWIRRCLKICSSVGIEHFLTGASCSPKLCMTEVIS